MNWWQGVGARAQNRGAEPRTDPVTMAYKMGARGTPETFGQTRRGRGRGRGRGHTKSNGRSTPSKRPPVNLDDLDLCQERHFNAYKLAGIKVVRSKRGGGKGRGGGCRVRINF